MINFLLILKVRQKDLIRLYPLSTLKYSPFHSAPERTYLGNHGVVLVEKPKEANIFLSLFWPLIDKRHRKILSKIYRKPVLVWTHEPRFCELNADLVRGGLFSMDVHIMNPLNGKVATNNHCWYVKPMFFDPAVRGILPKVSSRNLRPRKGKEIVALSTWRPARKLPFQGKDIDLIKLRQDLTLNGFQRGVCDVWGRQWPKGMSQGESRGDGWWEKKMSILSRYRFNIALESTNIDFYCTEKIWHAIGAHCLPIYYGSGNRIYDDFPLDSFLDLALYENPYDLYDHVRDMSDQEYIDRLNRCIDVYNSSFISDAAQTGRQQCLDMIIEKAHSMVATPH